MKKYFCLILGVLIYGAVLGSPFSLAAAQEDNATMAAADQLREEKSYRLAAEQYHALRQQAKLVSAEEMREINFKFADSSWRTKETDRYEEAVKILKELTESIDHDRWWAEASESLAEHYFEIDRWQHQEEIKDYLENSREYWAISSEIDLARKRFIKVSFTFGDYISQNFGWYYQEIKPSALISDLGPRLDAPHKGLHILYEEILLIAKSDEDKAKAHYSLGMSYLQGYATDEQRKLAVKNFKEIIDHFPQSEWLDDAYFYLGQYYENRSEFDEALKVYQSLLAKFKKGTSQWVDDIERRVKDIISPQIRLGVSYTFLPESQIEYSLNWRNIDQVKFSFYKMDLPNSMQFNPKKKETDYDYGIENYLKVLQLMVESKQYLSLPVALSFTSPLKNEKKYQWGSMNQGLADWRKDENEKEADVQKGILEPGAYLLMASANGAEAYELVLVTDLGLVTKSAAKTGLIFAFDAKTGAPFKNVKVKYQYRYYDDTGHYRWDEGLGQTDDSGIFNVNFKYSQNRNNYNQVQLFACASDGVKQACSQGGYYGGYGQHNEWWLYSTTDRPAYRPNEEVSFKGTLRRFDDQAFQSPAGMNVNVRLYDPRNSKILEKAFTLNDFGSFADRLTLDENAALGEYRMEVYSDDWKINLGQNVLFRLEEYKLPEFLVNIKPKTKEGETVSTYQLGDKLEIEVDAQYYFGGPVVNGEVEYLVYQKNYFHSYHPKRPYSWFYEDIYRSNYNYYDQGILVTKETIKTDEYGKASFTIDTLATSPQDLSYRVEVRVVDQSRREITASQEIKVTKNAFYAYLNPKNNLYRPGDKAEVEIKTLTANDAPVSVEGKVSITRNWWREPVLRDGKVVHEAHYEENPVITKFVKTDSKGETVFSFEPAEDGFYVVSFSGFDAKGNEVKNQTNVYVCSKQSKEIGMQYSGLQIIPEKDTYHLGENIRLMLVADRPDTWVLLTSEADEIYDYSLYHLEGSVKLLEIPVREGFLPNIFFSAVSGDHYQLKNTMTQIIIPPDEKFLNVKILSDKEIYKPQEEGKFEIEVTDKNGQPVVGEISLGLVDASVYYIQEDLAQDIRQFFYGTKRQLSVQTQSSFNQRMYQKLERSKENSNGIFVDDENLPKDLVSKVGQARQEIVGGEYDGDKLMSNERVFSKSKSDVGSPVAAIKAEGKMARENSELRSDMAASAPMAEEQMLAENLSTPQIRSDFRSTVFWQPSIVTDENGRASVTVKFPDSLTTWRATARSLTQDTRVGNVTQETKTSKDVIVRLQAPRFFTERDEVTISANVHNYTDKPQKIKVTLEAKGLKIIDNAVQTIEVAPEGEQRVDWKVNVENPGNAEITVMAQAKDDSDAMVKNFPVIPHGIEKFIAQALVLKGNEEEQIKEFTLDIPAERIKESTALQLNLSPSMAGALMDALPYLAKFPYGCVEQTLSRFLPAVIVKKTLKDLGLNDKDINQYLENVLGKRNDPSTPYEDSETLDQLDQMTKDGLNRLYDFQHSDGGWGWWKEGDSDRFMSAYVVWGLGLAKEAGLNVKSDVLSRGINFLQKELVEEENNPDMLAWMLHALSAARSNSGFEDKQTNRLWEMRDKLNPYTRALFALSEFNRGHNEQAQTLARNLIDGMQEDKDNGTVHWGEEGIYYRFSDGGVEATAFCLKALINISPESQYIEPAVKWLSLNRRGGRWKNTRDTAIAILGLSDYVKKTNELNPNYGYVISVNGKTVQEGQVNTQNVFTFNRIIDIPSEALKDGANHVKVSLEGAGSLYVAGYLKYFTKEENITPAGNEVFVQREYFIEDTKPTLLKGYKPDWKPLKNGGVLKSGDRVRVDVILEAKNNYEYLIIEDNKPAGLEAVELKSGSSFAKRLRKDGRETDETIWLYQEFRDQRAVFFIDKLKQGKVKISYELRAEVPGTFHAMPNETHAMYVPEIRANSSEMQVTVEDKE